MIHVIGIDPGACCGIALLRSDRARLSLVLHRVVKSQSVMTEWIPAAAKIVSLVSDMANTVKAETGLLPFVGMEYPIQHRNARGYGAQMALFAAIEAMLLSRGLTISVRVNPNEAKKAIGVPASNKKSTVKERKDAMVKMAKLQALWPAAEPKNVDERYALADAIAHALATLKRIPPPIVAMKQ